MDLKRLDEYLETELNEDRAIAGLKKAYDKFVNKLGGLKKAQAMAKKWFAKPENKKILDALKQKYSVTTNEELEYINEALRDFFNKNKRKFFVSLLFAIAMGIVPQSAMAAEPATTQAPDQVTQMVQQNQDALQDLADNAREAISGLFGRLGSRIRGGDVGGSDGPEPDTASNDYDDLPDGPLANKRVSTSGLTSNDILDAYKEAYGNSEGANKYNQLNNAVSSETKVSDVASPQMQQRAWLQKAMAKLPSQVVQQLQADGDITIRS